MVRRDTAQRAASWLGVKNTGEPPRKTFTNERAERADGDDDPRLDHAKALPMLSMTSACCFFVDRT